MYNLSGILYRIWAVGGIFLLGLIICVILDLYDAHKKSKTNCKNNSLKKHFIFYGVAFIYLLGYMSFYAYKYVNPQITIYEGCFVEWRRDSKVAPPLPFTSAYIFVDENNQKSTFYIDVDTKNELYLNDFVVDRKYKIYFEDDTKIIVRVEDQSD